MADEAKTHVALEIGHVLFVDIVGYSKLLIHEQLEHLEFASAESIDWLTTAMREIAVATSTLFKRLLNPFLQDKVGERTINSYQRIVSSYG